MSSILSSKKLKYTAFFGAFLACSAVLSAPFATADDTETVATIRVLHQNIYGRDKAECAKRYHALAQHILEANPPYDIVSLNEHWNTAVGDLVGETCDSDILTDALMAGDGRYRDSWDHDRSRLSYPRGDFFQSNGGNSILTTHRIVGFDSWTFENSNDLPIAGFMRSQIEVAPGVTLDFWTTHLEASSDHCDEHCHQVQIRHLADYVSMFSGWYNDDGWYGHASLIAGDFNIGGPLSLEEAREGIYHGHPGYDFLMSYFKNARDLWLEAHPTQDSPDDGYTYDPATNRLADGSTRDRIDYLLAPSHPAYLRSFDSVRVKEMNVVRWKTADGTPISDHYGLDTTLEVIRRKIDLPSAQDGGDDSGILVHAR